MTRDQAVQAWLRFLSGGQVPAEERGELVQAMSADPGLWKELFADAEIDGLLRAFGAGDQDAEGFLQAILDFLSAEKDATGFVNRVESRMEREGFLPPPPGRETQKKFNPGFGKPESMQYNSSRAMPSIVNLEGSEEDFARLLVFHRIINKDQLQKAMEDRQSHAAKAGGVETLRDTLLRTKVVVSPLIFDVLRVASKVVEACTKCNAMHHIHFYHPSSRYFCSYCKGPLRVTDPGQSLKWQPGELVRSVNEINAPVAEAKPPGSETIERLATKPEAPAAEAKPAAKPAPLPFEEAVKGSSGDTVTIAPGGDETMLDMGITPRTSSKPAAAKPPAAPPPPPPEPAKTGAEGLPSWMDEKPAASLPQDESLLDFGLTPRSSSKPAPLPKLAKEGQEHASTPLGTGKPSVPLPADQSVGNVAGGGETMLDMGVTPRASSKPAEKPPETVSGLGGGTTMLDLGTSARKVDDKDKVEPIDPTKTIVPTPGAGETMLDMGITPPKRHVQDMTTSVFPGSRKEIPTGIPKAPPEKPVLPASDSNPSYDLTTRAGTKSDPTFMLTPPSQRGMTPPGTSSSTVDKTQIQQTTPKTGSGGSSAAIANAKALPPEVAQAAKDANRVFGKYILMSELGRGGAGVVYKAWDTLILQYVALKFIKNQDEDTGDSTSGSSQIEEFQREARMSVRLRHPNIVRIYELGSMSNRYYLAMEYIEGGNLLAMIHGGKDRNTKTKFNSDPLKFLTIMKSIAFAVDYAHNTKPPIIHRDLKPHNVLVSKEGTPYVVDFGLAKEVDQGDGATLTGVVKGTPTYMSPEQAEGRNRDVDPRTDVYALGAILYEMLTGRPPFLGESVPEILRKIATELPERPNDVITKNAIAEAASSTANSKTKTKPLMIPKPLETICLKAIEKAKPDRYQSAKELGEDIERYLKDEDILAQEPNLYRRVRRQMRQHPILTAAAAALFLAGVTGGIVAKFSTGPIDNRGQIVLQGILDDGQKALTRMEAGKIDPDWPALRQASDGLARIDKNHSKIVEWEKALKDHRDLVEKTEREWSADLDRIRREPLAQVLSGLREKYHRCSELKPKLKESLRLELLALQGRLVAEAKEMVGSGARPAWVESLIKTKAKEAREQAEMLIGLAKDPDFMYPTEASLEEARDGLGRVIIYQGTWTLQVNVAPFAEVTLSRAENELKTDFTPIGLQELEVVGSSYVVELCWPSRENPKIKMKEEIKDIHHGQTVVIRGDLAKEILKQERQEKPK